MANEPKSDDKPGRYRKLPVEIEAIRWTGNNLRAAIDFTGRHPSADAWTWEYFEEMVRTKGLKIFTLEGHHMASVGDYIIRGVKGEFYPCKPDIFAMTYEPADVAVPPRKQIGPNHWKVKFEESEKELDAERRKVVQLEHDAARDRHIAAGCLMDVDRLKAELSEAQAEIAEAANRLHDGLHTGGHGGEMLLSIVERVISVASRSTIEPIQLAKLKVYEDVMITFPAGNDITGMYTDWFERLSKRLLETESELSATGTLPK